MKCAKTFLLVLAALAVSTTSIAQSNDAPKHWFCVSWSGQPTTASSNFKNYNGYNNYTYESLYNYDGDPVGYLYKDYTGSVYSIGNITGEFGWRVTRWFSWDVALGFCPMWQTHYDALSDNKAWTAAGCTVYAKADARISWVNRPAFRLMTTGGLGVGFNIGNGYNTAAMPIIQFDLIGIEFGRSLFGKAAFGLGTEFIGGRIGIGYRF